MHSIHDGLTPDNSPSDGSHQSLCVCVCVCVCGGHVIELELVYIYMILHNTYIVT